MDKSKDMSGLRFGRWSVISMAGKNSGGTALWLCRCSCGTERAVRGTELRYGQSMSCGCLNKEITRSVCIERNTTHGLSKTREYKIWKSMIARCHKKSNSSYPSYGGRGIVVCATWRKSFEAFIGDMGKCPDGLQIERIDNNGPYSKENCRWASRIEQCSNTRRNRYIKFGGKTLTVSEWSRQLGITQMALWKRLNRGMPLKRALTKGALKRE